MFLAVVTFVLAQLDYFLTIIGNKQRLKKYAGYVETDYELNPLFRKDVEKNRIINVKHLLLSVLMSVIVYMVTLAGNEILTEFFTGTVILQYLIVITVHIKNIWLFSKFQKKELFKGKISVTKEYTYFTARLNYLAYIILLSAVCIFSFSYFVLGGLFISVIMFITLFVWEKRVKS